MNKYKIEISMEKRDEKMIDISGSVSGKVYFRAVMDNCLPIPEQYLKDMIIRGYQELTQIKDE